MGRFTTRTRVQLAAERDFRTYIIIDFVFGFAAGLTHTYTFHTWQVENTLAGQQWVYYSIEVLGLISTVVALSAAELAWGWPEITKMHRRTLREALMCLWFAGFVGAFCVLWRGELFFFATGVWLLIFPTMLCGIRGWPLFFGALCSFGAEYAANCPTCNVVAPLFIKIAMAVGFPARLRYLHDQRLAFCICIQPQLAFLVGQWFRPAVSREWLVKMAGGSAAVYVGKYSVVLAVAFGLLYGNLLLRSRRRSLPPGLCRAKFVRLGYLRKMLRNGEKIRRCQELPEEAFGDASKAIHLIVLSHRWHDPRTSDVATPEFPQGVKLYNLVRRLDAHFFPSSGGGFWQYLLRWYRTSCIGGWDVLLFFDFLSIPQNGIAEDGSTILRTPEETAVFVECLPNMGTLYSLFPVLALTDVPEGDSDHDYIGSGWCLCEFTIAMLTQQLTPYSEDTLRSFGRRSLIDASMQSMGVQAAEGFQQSAMAELQRRPFYHESDRMVAAGIIEAFLTKRLMADSIRQGDRAQVQRLLLQLKRDDLLSTLDEPVDGGLNTLLHIAVQSRSVHMVIALLIYGARPNLRNLRGDTPSQWFLLPRLSTAAMVVRNVSRDTCGGTCGIGTLMPKGDVSCEGGVSCDLDLLQPTQVGQTVLPSGSDCEDKISSL